MSGVDVEAAVGEVEAPPLEVGVGEGAGASDADEWLAGRVDNPVALQTGHPVKVGVVGGDRIQAQPLHDGQMKGITREKGVVGNVGQHVIKIGNVGAN
jgi:hypothetical protein